MLTFKKKIFINFLFIIIIYIPIILYLFLIKGLPIHGLLLCISFVTYLLIIIHINKYKFIFWIYFIFIKLILFLKHIFQDLPIKNNVFILLFFLGLLSISFIFLIAFFFSYYNEKKK